MAKEYILSGLYEVMSDYIEELPETLNEDMCLTSDVGIDSFSLANMILAIEDKFNVEISDRDLVNFNTIGDMTRYLQHKLG